MRKTLSFAVVHVTVAVTVGYALTGSLAVGGAIALIEPLCNTIAFHLHEAVWQRRRARRYSPSSSSRLSLVRSCRGVQ